MSNFTVATRYALSLLESTEEKNNLEKISEDIEFVHGTFQNSKELRNVIKSPVIKFEQKKAILADLFKMNVSNDTFNFLMFVLKKNREDLFIKIFERFLQLRNEKLGIVHATVMSSVNLSDTQKDQIKSQLEQFISKKVKPDYELDEKIIGGFVVRIGDTIVDASIKHQLEKLKQKFISGSVLLN